MNIIINTLFWFGILFNLLFAIIFFISQVYVINLNWLFFLISIIFHIFMYVKNIYNFFLRFFAYAFIVFSTFSIIVIHKECYDIFGRLIIDFLFFCLMIENIFDITNNIKSRDLFFYSISFISIIFIEIYYRYKRSFNHS